MKRQEMKNSLTKNHLITKTLKASSAPSCAEDAFSLLELIAALTILSTLTAISLVGFTGKGGIIGQINFANIDEAKALLNSAAADCLQRSRINKENKDSIDEEIISDIRISSLGFSIDKEAKADKCSYFQLKPKSKDDDLRYPIGFSVVDGILTKFSTPTSTDKRSISSCQRWAGINCKMDSGFIEIVMWKREIEKAKAACAEKYDNWLTKLKTQPSQYNRWNPNADSGCPDKPPKDGSTSYKTNPTCTPNGCNRTVYGLDGKFVGFTKEDYDRALGAKYGKACTEWVASKKQPRYTNNPQNRPATLKECGSQEFWFYKGIDAGSKEEFDKRICSDNLENEKLTNGKRTVQGCGSKVYYFCDNKIKESEKDYKECSCDVEKYKKAQAGTDGAFKTTETGASGCGNFWICKKEILSDQGSYDNKCGASKAPPPTPQSCYRPAMTCDRPNFYTHPGCKAYNKCMGRI